MEDLKNLEVKNWKETAKGRRTWTDLAGKVKTHKGLQCKMMVMMMMMMYKPSMACALFKVSVDTVYKYL